MSLCRRVERLETAAQAEEGRRHAERVSLINRALACRADPTLSPAERARVSRIEALLHLARRRREGVTV